MGTLALSTPKHAGRALLPRLEGPELESLFTPRCGVQRCKGVWAAAEEVPSVLSVGGGSQRSLRTVSRWRSQEGCQVNRRGEDRQGPNVDLAAGGLSTVHPTFF